MLKITKIGKSAAKTLKWVKFNDYPVARSTFK